MNEVEITPSMDWTTAVIQIKDATGESEQEVREAVKQVVLVHDVPKIAYTELMRKVQSQLAKKKREFRSKDYVSARGKKVMRRAVGSSGGTCSNSYAQNYERNMLSRNPKAKLPGKIRRALGDF